tara:strand:- start:3311 stop:5080 length:1770 start_codon:yes stop_codon:yes gene_type:complete
MISKLRNTFYLPILIFLWRNLKKDKKFRIIKLLLIMLICGLAELVSLSSVIPFLVVLTDPNKLNDIQFISPLVDAIGIENKSNLILAITFCFIVATIFTMVVRLLNIRLTGNTSASIGSDLSDMVYTNILHKPYSWHVNINSSNFLSDLTNNLTATVTFITSALRIISSLIIIVFIIFGLIAINPKVAYIAFSFFSISYILLAFFIRKKVSINGIFLERSYKKQFKLLQESLGAIREVILSNNQKFFAESYIKIDKPIRFKEAQNAFYGQSPRFILESVSLILIAIIAYLLTTTNIQNSQVIAILGTFAVGSQRLLPSMQQVFSEWANMKVWAPMVQSVFPLIKKNESQDKQFSTQKDKKYLFQKEIQFKNLSFSYNKYKFVLEDVNLLIKKGDKVGIIGETGGGKSTLINLLMGLLEPTSGEIFVDGKKLNFFENRFLNDWRSSISHVPQNIFLADSSIMENIAFGVDKNKIDFKKVKLAAKKAKIDVFINSLREGYHSLIGERGVRLSGGQRQRLGIARALYENSKIIIFDEATSALDNITEESVIKTINDLSKDITLIMIAHRLTTLQGCNIIYKVENSTIKKVEI